MDELIGKVVVFEMIDRAGTEPTYYDAKITGVSGNWLRVIYKDGKRQFVNLNDVSTITIIDESEAI